MSIQPLYRDFFRFLERLSAGNDPWASYQEVYLEPHLDFFRSYWQIFPHMGPEQVAGRVRRVRRDDYGLLESLIASQDPTELAGEALRRCQSVLPLSPEPAAYLFVGFFSPDGMTIDVNGAPVIAFALERFRDFRDLPLLVAHEYGHCLRGTGPFPGSNGQSLAAKVMREGLAVLFTELVYPEIPLARRLFLTPERWHWCRENRGTLLELARSHLSSADPVPVFFGPGDPEAGIPPRVGYYVAREMLRDHGGNISPVRPGVELIQGLRTLPDEPGTFLSA